MKILRNRHFWLVLALFIILSSFQYVEQFGLPRTITPSYHFGLTRHSLERILLIGPIVYAGLVFGLTGGLFTTFGAFLVCLPRAIAISHAPLDALSETVGMTLIGILISVWFWLQARQKTRQQIMLKELDSTRLRLQDNLDTITLNESRLTILNAISATLFGSLELEGLFQKANHMVCELMSAEIAFMYCLDEESQELILVASEGIPEEFVRSIGTINVTEGIYGEVAKTGRCLVSTDITGDPRINSDDSRKLQIKSQLIVPLLLKEKINGVICVATRCPREFSQYEIGLLKTVGTQISVAIENACLYERQREIARRLAISEGNYRRLFEHASDAIWVHNLKGVITAANRAAGELMGFSNAEELVGSDVRNVLPEAGRVIARRVRDQLLNNNPLEQPYEQHLLRRDKTEVILMVTTSLVKHEDSPPVFEHVARDVTRERHMQDNLRKYVQEITKTQEEERNRIARDLHDDTAQALYALNRQVDNFIRGYSGTLPEETSGFLKSLEEQIKGALQGVRRFSQDLRPPMLDDLGLLATLRWLVRDMKQRCNIEAELTVTGKERRLASHVELAIFRITQESLRNVEKHAQASKVMVEIIFETERLTITMQDNGKGFKLSGDLGDLPRGGRLGLVGMDERARLLGGSITINSELDQGTRVTIEVPV